MHFLKMLFGFNVSNGMLWKFYTAFTESILTYIYPLVWQCYWSTEKVSQKESDSRR